MTIVKTSIGRRSFIKISTLASGGMLLGFNWLASCNPSAEQVKNMPKEWFEINGYLKIGDNGLVTIMSPNPEIGQNVKTSMPMLVAEELDIDWKDVIVEQAPLNTDIFTRQLAGGSQSIRQGWQSLRMAGATARQMLKQAAANAWEVPVTEITSKAGNLYHKSTDKSASYGEMASVASQLDVPKEVELKDVEDFTIIGTSRKNVDGNKIITGKPLYGIDYEQEGMLIAMAIHPLAFGMQLKSFDDSAAKKMPGIKDIFTIDTYPEDYKMQWSDTDAFSKLLVIVGDSTWQVMNAKKALKATWEISPEVKKEMEFFGSKMSVNTPSGLEDTKTQYEQMIERGAKSGETVRKDGNFERIYKNCAKTIERNYSAPFLAHNTMEPMNFFANVTVDKAELVGPIQTPEFMEKSISQRLDMPLENIDIQMTRMGGGFGRRLYGHFMVEAALISQKMKAPVKLIYTREDDMSFGTYRPTYYVNYKAGLDENNNLIAFYVNAGGIPESPLFANRFPAGAVDNYTAEQWTIDSNVSVGAFRAPRSNFIAGAEQSFLDEVAEMAGKDPIAFRLELLDKAQQQPVGEKNDYDAKRYAGVLKLVKEKSEWNEDEIDAKRGVAAYYCHNSYVANVLDMKVTNGQPVIDKVHCAIDCGIVVNPDAATNLAEGGIVDGIGNAMYGQLTLKDGEPQQTNFDKYRMIRHGEAPKAIEVHFVKNEIDPTGLGEPPFPPVFGALANALYKTTGKRYYNQPFISDRTTQLT